MTRKHYCAIAAAFAETRNECPETNESRAALAKLARKMAGIYKRDNSAFVSSRFYEACGLDSAGIR